MPLLISLILLLLVLFFAWTVFSGGPYTPIPQRHLERLFAQVPLQAGDVVVDMGSGDGRVLIHVAKAYGANGRGYDLNPVLIVISFIWSHLAGVGAKTRWFWRSYFEANLATTDLIFLHVLPRSTGALVKKIKADARSDVRVLSYGATLDGLEELETIRLQEEGERSLFPAVAYLYRLPAGS